MNKASSDAVKDILETLHEDPWIESECYHGDLLMALKLFLKKQTEDNTWQGIEEEFEQLYRTALAAKPV